MKIIRYIFILIIININIFSCKTSDGKINSDIKSENDETAVVEKQKIYLNIVMSKEIKINSKNVLFDLTSDIKKYITKYDNTDDLLESNNFIFRKDDLEDIDYEISILKNTIKEKINNLFNDEKINFEINDYIEDIADNSIVIYITLIDLNEGEYNLIKNKSTKINTITKIFYKNNDNKKNTMFVRTYKQKSSIDYPIIKHRLINIGTIFANDIYKILKNFINT